ncbi:MAG: hypothetical protein IPN77_15735 [Sandaracinaceae bacterium]|nr:hypothetical protein [Sandaracinaceae bacterium]
MTSPASALHEILVPAALTIALVGFTEVIATARAIAEPGSVVRPSQELAALGVPTRSGPLRRLPGHWRAVPLGYHRGVGNARRSRVP